MTSEERHILRYQRRKAKRLEKKMIKYGDCDDFLKVFTYEHLWEASKKCMRGVRWKASVQKFVSNRALNIAIIRKELMEGKLKIKDSYEFYLYERGKRRHIRSIGIKERVVQRCLCDYSLVPMLQRTFIYDNGASMAGKGVGFTRKRLRQQIRYYIKTTNQEGYVLVFDFKKYFESIPHELILKILHKNYTDQRIVDLIMQFVKFSNNDRGIDLGSQISQVLALAAANEIDHIIKEKLRFKCYGRYMDDGCMIDNNKEWLKMCKDVINSCAIRLGLTLNLKKTRIVKLSKGFVFLKNKYRVIDNRLLITPTKDSTVRIRRRLKKLNKKLISREIEYNDILQSYQAWAAHLNGTRCYRTVQSMSRLFDKLFIDFFAVDYDRFMITGGGELCIIK